MQVGVIGLGRMGKNIVLHLLEKGVGVVAYNRSPDKLAEVTTLGAIGALTFTEIPLKITVHPKIVFLFITAGVSVDEVLFGTKANATALPERDIPRTLVEQGLADVLPVGSIIVDAGNSFYLDSQRRYKILKERQIHFLDMGTSGGLEGARTGACLMVGGDRSVYEFVKPLLSSLAQPKGLGYFGASGAGHFVKMIHNAIEYGMMGALAEGVTLAKNSEFNINIVELMRVWNSGSIIRGFLLEMLVRALNRDPFLGDVPGSVPRGETEVEMEWLGREIRTPHPVIQQARMERVESRQHPSFVGKVIAALRREFGGHEVK